MKPKQIALVYQCGLANVFDNTAGRERKRLLQGTFGQCEMFALGAVAMGASLFVYHCDKCGDIAKQKWQEGPGDMFADSKWSSGK